MQTLGNARGFCKPLIHTELQSFAEGNLVEVACHLRWGEVALRKKTSVPPQLLLLVGTGVKRPKEKMGASLYLFMKPSNNTYFLKEIKEAELWEERKSAIFSPLRVP